MRTNANIRRELNRSDAIYACVPEGIVTGFLCGAILAGAGSYFLEPNFSLLPMAMLVLIGITAGAVIGGIIGLFCGCVERIDS